MPERPDGRHVWQRVDVTNYEQVLTAAKGMDALRRELAGEELEDSPFPHRLAGNLFPRIDVVQDNGYTKEEMKIGRAHV